MCCRPHYKAIEKKKTLAIYNQSYSHLETIYCILFNRNVTVLVGGNFVQRLFGQPQPSD